MFGLGLGEIFLIVISVFLILSPKDFLKVIRSMGKYYRQFLNMKESVTKMTELELINLHNTEESSEDSSGNE